LNVDETVFHVPADASGCASHDIEVNIEQRVVDVVQKIPEKLVVAQITWESQT
jgi:hypothetical protein